jgi:hypothetical protein
MGYPGTKYGNSIGNVTGVTTESVRMANAPGYGGTASSWQPGPLPKNDCRRGRQDSPPDDPSPTRFNMGAK